MNIQEAVTKHRLDRRRKWFSYCGTVVSNEFVTLPCSGCSCAFTLQDGNAIFIKRDEIYSYRGTSEGTTFYLKDKSVHYVTEDFDTVDKIFDYLTPVTETNPYTN